jgi:hypothetical protein
MSEDELLAAQWLASVADPPKQEDNAGGKNPSAFKQGDVLRNLYQDRLYKVEETADVNGVGKLRDLQDDTVGNWNWDNNPVFELYNPKSNEWTVVSTYTRAEAIGDGTLVDITEDARILGIKYPVAVTGTAFHELSEASENWLVNLLLDYMEYAVKTSGDRFWFTCLGVKLWALCGPGDTPEPVVTIMLEGED